MHQFDEHHPEFKGFSQYFFDEMRPYLFVREKDRKQAVASVRNIRLGGAGLGIVGAIFMAQKAEPIAAIFSAFFAFIVVSILSGRKLKGLKGQTKTKLVTGVCDFLGWQFLESAVAPTSLRMLQTNRLLPGGVDRAHFEDQISGQVHGTDFQSVEALLQRRDQDEEGRVRYVTLFRGQIMEIDFHKDFSGRTVVLRDKGWFNKEKKSGMKRVGLVDPVFEKIFEAYGTDQVEARYLLTPDVMQKLVDLEQKLDGKKIRFAFLESKLYIVVATPNRYEAGSMFQSLMAPERTQRILDEIGAIYDVIDGIMAPLSERNA